MVRAHKVTTRRTRRACIMLPAPQVSSAPQELQTRVAAFADAPNFLSVAQLAQMLAAPAGYRVPAIGIATSAAKPGAAYLVKDGVAQCILRLNHEFGVAYVAELRRKVLDFEYNRGGSGPGGGAYDPRGSTPADPYGAPTYGDPRDPRNTREAHPLHIQRHGRNPRYAHLE